MKPIKTEQIKKLRPMNAQHGSVDDLENKKYIYEPKLDGFRALCLVDKAVTFISHNGNDVTDDYQKLSFRKLINAKSCIFDGEIVYFDEKGVPRSALLKQNHPAHYIVFDILMKDGVWLIDKPLHERKKILEKTVSDGDHIAKIPFSTNGKQLWRTMQKKGLAGVMAKEINSPYYPNKRSPVWLTIKSLNAIDCVIIGYTTTKNSVSSLLLGLYDKQGKKIRYVGKVNDGLSEKLLGQLQKKCKKLETQKSLLSDPLPRATLVDPMLSCEINYVELTKEGRLRSPSFLRLHTDKDPKVCTLDQIG